MRPVRGRVVQFQILGYEGTENMQQAAQNALRGIPSLDWTRMHIDDAGRTLTIGTRGASISTGPARSALERAGFRIGPTSVRTL
jgi:hypothetical protein